MAVDFKFCPVNGNAEYLPKRATPASTGWDVKAAITSPLYIRPFDSVKISLGFKVFCPDGWALQLVPRSSTFAKKNLSALYGQIDNDFENVLLFACQYIPPAVADYGKLVYDSRVGKQSIAESCASLTIMPGECIAQIIPVRVNEMTVTPVTEEQFKELCETRGGLRGLGGFGSTS